MSRRTRGGSGIRSGSGPTTSAGVAAPTFLPAPSPLAMWARRQAHETSIHRCYAESATGATTGFDPTFAADGIDELLYGFYESVTRTAETTPTSVRPATNESLTGGANTPECAGISADERRLAVACDRPDLCG